MTDGTDEISDRDAPERIYEDAKETLSEAQNRGDITDAEHDAITDFCSAYDKGTPSVPKPDGESHRTYNTLRAWMNRLRLVASRLDVDMTEATADDINQLWDASLDGSHPDVKDDGLSTNTVTSQQSTVRTFYEYHTEYGIDVSDLAVIAPEKNTVDERDVFDGEEIDAMREAIDHPRDLALFDLLVYTGQRLRAVQTLRVGDIDLDDATFYLNDDAEGLKGASGKRPLLGAEASVRRWINQFHPNPVDDAYLICHRGDYRKDHDAKDTLSQKTIRRILHDIADEAGVDKPSNPHHYRHSFVTIAKREYDLDDLTIKGLIGHKMGSNVMEETYAHLKDEDHVRAAQRATGTGDPDEGESPLSPDFCLTCDEPLPDRAKACPACGTTYTPDAHSVKQQVQDDIYEGKGAAEDAEEEAAVDALKELVEDNPEKVIKLLEDR